MKIEKSANISKMISNKKEMTGNEKLPKNKIDLFNGGYLPCFLIRFLFFYFFR